MPHVVREVMNYCCPKSAITFGHQFTSINDIENHYSTDPELDISFPLYGKHVFAVQKCFFCEYVSHSNVAQLDFVSLFTLCLYLDKKGFAVRKEYKGKSFKNNFYSEFNSVKLTDKEILVVLYLNYNLFLYSVR